MVRLKVCYDDMVILLKLSMEICLGMLILSVCVVFSVLNVMRLLW